MNTPTKIFYTLFRPFARIVLNLLFRVKVHNMEYFYQAGRRVLIIANHTSFLDVVLLAVYLPERLTFAIDPHIASQPWVRPFLFVANTFPMDPSNPLSLKSLIRYLKQDNYTVIFPEGRITVTGTLMKVYQGSGLVAEKSGAMLLPIRIDGAQYTPLSRLRGRVRLRWFPPITLTLLPPQEVRTKKGKGDERNCRDKVGHDLTDIMTKMMFETSQYQCTLFDALRNAQTIHGGKHLVLDDADRDQVNYRQLISRSLTLGYQFAHITRYGDYVGLLMPNSVGGVIAFFALQSQGRIPALLPVDTDKKSAQCLKMACDIAQIHIVYTSRQFVKASKLELVIEELSEHVRIFYLEDTRNQISHWKKFRGKLGSYLPGKQQIGVDAPAVALFKKDVQDKPCGIVLSHVNLLANREQMVVRNDLNAQDIVLNATPHHRAFGLSATLIPILSGIRCCLYPAEHHYRIVPEISYARNATILFGNPSTLGHYAKAAHPYDFYSLRYVFTGEERVLPEVRELWAKKFGQRLMESLSIDETSPILSINTAMDYREGSMGRLLPGIDYFLQTENKESNEGEGRLMVKGPNIMLGYISENNAKRIVFPQSKIGHGWFDTGYIVRVDKDGFLWFIKQAEII